MIRDFIVANFEAIREIKLEGLSNVVVVLGKRNSGKSSLLRAFALATNINTHVNPDIRGEFITVKPHTKRLPIWSLTTWQIEMYQNITMQARFKGVKSEPIKCIFISDKFVYSNKQDVSFSDFATAYRFPFSDTNTIMPAVRIVDSKNFHLINPILKELLGFELSPKYDSPNLSVQDMKISALVANIVKKTYNRLTGEISGIAVIDNFDSGISYELQVPLLSALSKMLPTVQFIVACSNHSAYMEIMNDFTLIQTEMKNFVTAREIPKILNYD